jgi:hypothetical protein
MDMFAGASNSAFSNELATVALVTPVIQHATLMSGSGGAANKKLDAMLVSLRHRAAGRFSDIQLISYATGDVVVRFV